MLLIVALMALIAASMLSVGRTAYRISHNSVVRAQSDALVNAAIIRAVLALVDIRANHRWRADSAANVFMFGGMRITVRVQDELGKIDLNASDEESLASLLASTGLSSSAAHSLADKILDWRSLGELRRLNGADVSDYRSLGYPYHPRRGPFQTVDELKLVMGVTPEIFAQVEAALTVYSGRPLINPQTAPRTALLAMPSAEEGTVNSLLAARAEDQDGGTVSSAVIDPAVTLGGRAFTIAVEFGDRDYHVNREAVVRLTGDTTQPYWVLATKGR